jgi:hypothetical protein
VIHPKKVKDGYPIQAVGQGRGADGFPVNDIEKDSRGGNDG